MNRALPHSRPVSKIAALVSLVALATCVEQRTPTSSSEPSIADLAETEKLVTSVTQTLLTQGTNVTNQRIYTTTAIAPAPNALITVAVLGHNSSTAPPSPTLSGGGMTAWTEVVSVTLDGAVPLKRLTIFRAMSATPGSGPLTITFSATVSNAQWIVSQWDGVDPTGANGAGAIVQTGSARGDAVSGLSVTLAPFASADNAAYGVFGVRATAPVVTPGAGFTEIAEQPSGESTPADLQAQWTLNDPTIDASWTSLNGAALGVEIRAGAGGGGGGGVSAGLSTATASPDSITAGSGTTTITVIAKDASGSPVSGATVVLAATGTGNTLTQPAGPTDAAGTVTGTIASTVAGTKTVTATANGVTITQAATVTVVAGPVSASQSTVVAAPTTIAPGSGSTITVTARDAHGNPVSGAAVTLTAAGSATSVTQPAGPTDASGVATGTVSATAEGTVTVSATIGGTAITQTAAVNVMTQTVAAITQTLLTSGNNPANTRVSNTASISPAAGALVTVAVMGHRSGGASPVPVLSGGGMTAWTQVATVTFDGVASPLKRITIFRAMSQSPGSGPITITFASGQSNSQWIVSQWTGVDDAGVNGAGAIGQAGTTRADAATGLAVPLTAFGNANNVAVGVFGVRRNAVGVSPGTGFTEIAEQPSAENTPSDLQAEWTTNDNTIDATWAAANGGALGVELVAGHHAPATTVVSVDVAPPSASVAVGGTVQLAATAQNAEGEPLTGYAFTWTSAAPAVASVSSTGLVTGVGAGTATITATTAGVAGTASITVTATSVPVASVEVTPSSVGLSVGGTAQLAATTRDAAGTVLTGRAVSWGTDAPVVATVSTTGLVTGVGAGTATITATSEGQSGTAGVTVTVGGQSSLVGEWSAVLPAPLILIHTHLMPDGKVLIFGRTGVQVWDPATGAFTSHPSPSLLFCSGHDFLPDGRLFVTGGGGGDGLGLRNTNIFDYLTASWIVEPAMSQGRWYPTNTTLPNGEVITIAGQDETGTAVPVPEIWNGTGFRQLTTASLSLPNYPRMFLAPDGRLFYAGAQQQTRFLDVTGTGSWITGPVRMFGGRSYGSAVMYEAGKILYVGGANPPTNTAEIIDLNSPSPAWTYTGSLADARWNLNATVLPTGEVLVTGGVRGDRSNPALAVNSTELWNPATGAWTALASSASLLRGYHSTSLLLPDGRVLHGGGGGGGGTIDNYNYELFSPPYLFRGARPTVTGTTPETVGYGQVLSVETPDAASIVKVTLIRHGSVTHAFDAGQRLVSLSFSPGAGGLSVSLPASAAVAPPGPYMLFLVNGNGAPSIARIMRLQ